MGHTAVIEARLATTDLSDSDGVGHTVRHTFALSAFMRGDLDEAQAIWQENLQRPRACSPKPSITTSAWGWCVNWPRRGRRCWPIHELY